MTPVLEPNGYIDLYGLHPVANGWLFCGWVVEGWPSTAQLQITLRFEHLTLNGQTQAILFPRNDAHADGANADGDAGMGLIFFLPTPDQGPQPDTIGALEWARITVEDTLYHLLPASEDVLCHEPQLGQSLRPLLQAAPATPQRDWLLAKLTRPAFNGENTLSTLHGPVRAHVEECFSCTPQGLTLCGWLEAPVGVVQAMRVRSGALSTPVDATNSLRLERADVTQALRDELNVDDSRCGFIACLPNAVAAISTTYLEIETTRGETAHLPIPTPRLHGLAAITYLLERIDLRYDETAPGFDHVLGPAVRALHATQRARTCAVSVLDFGPAPHAPRISVIVPLYGRIDFMDYQQAIFARDASLSGQVDLIYVLDDPSLLRATQALAESAYERFQVPFRLISLEHNLGYAPANNIGLRHARGTMTCFLNSDVMPITPGWLDALATHLDTTPTLGAIGPLLLYEDGSVQHQGITFEALAEFGGWMFPQHPRKGWKPGPSAGVQTQHAITGACLMMRTAQARDLGGFDEDYIIGDFEDTDLCLRLARMGLSCAVDDTIRLFHLERRSQADGGLRWRMNLTLYNAWLHQHRWFSSQPRRTRRGRLQETR